MKTKRIFRIEHTKTKAGMWYDYDGTYNGIIDTLTEGQSKDAPMPKPKHKDLKDKKWFGAVSSMENLLLWFSPLDMQELKAKGYSLYEIECIEWIDIGTEILFTREGIKTKKELVIMLISQDGNSIWGKDDIVSIYIKKTEKGYSVIVLTRDYEERLANYSTEKVAKQELRLIANWKSKGYAQSYEMSQEKDGELI